jgi:uncharacterized protein (TIGR02391 family)
MQAARASTTLYIIGTHPKQRGGPLFTMDGGIQADGSWSRIVWERWGHRFVEALTASDYVEACERIEAEAVNLRRPTAPPVGRRLRRPIQASDTGSLDLVVVADALHPRIRDASRQLLVDGHLRAAALDASIALRDLFRERSGLYLDGEPLVSAALAYNKERSPKVTVADLATDTGQNVQRGTMLIAQGVIASIRNVVAHDAIELAPEEALEMLGAISLVARRIAPDAL